MIQLSVTDRKLNSWSRVSNQSCNNFKTFINPILIKLHVWIFWVEGGHIPVPTELFTCCEVRARPVRENHPWQNYFFQNIYWKFGLLLIDMMPEGFPQVRVNTTCFPIVLGLENLQTVHKKNTPNRISGNPWYQKYSKLNIRKPMISRILQT